MALIGIVFVILMVIGMPVAFATGIAGFIFFFTTQGMPMSIGVQKIASMSQSFPLLAVPFFVLAGHLMNESGITARLLKVALISVGWMSGGLAQVAIVLSTLMGGVSGSAVTCCDFPLTVRAIVAMHFLPGRSDCAGFIRDAFKDGVGLREVC